MISRMKNSVPLFLFLLSWSSIVTALDGTFNCQDPLLVGDLKFDLSSLDKEFSAGRERPTPPSVEVDTVKISLCSDLNKVDSLPEGDQVCRQFAARVVDASLTIAKCPLG